MAHKRTPKTKSRVFSHHFLQSRRFRRIAAIALGGGILLGIAQIAAPVRLRETTTLYIPLDRKARAREKAVIANLLPTYTLWHWIVRWGDIRPGRYVLQPGESAWQVWHRLSRGLQTPLQLYLRQQRSAEHLAQFLGTHLAHDSATWALAFHAYPWEKLGLNAHTWIAIFLPDVYEVYWTVSPEKLIQKVYEVYQRFWNEERRKKAEAIGLTPMEVMILASIIEYETYRASEKPLIASVYLNRLRLGMPLQADPTIIFATKLFQAQRVTKRMIEVDSPYNTYKRRGLPPGPIGTPTIESIEAVLNFTPSEYLYFCARPDGSGYHDFSKSYTEHQAKARAYQAALTRWLAQKK